MPYPDFTAQDLANFSGRPLASYTVYANEALAQALLLFKIGTCLANPPEDATYRELAFKGIQAMADSIYLAQAYQEAAASPFSSESIGSYSYSKTAKAVARGDDTGVMWFDLAKKLLSVCDIDDDLPAFGGIEVFDLQSNVVPNGGGVTRFLGPAEIDLSRNLGFDPAPGFRFEHVPPSGSPVDDDNEIELIEDPPGSGLYIIPGS